MTLRAERHIARMSKITNDGLTRSDTGCFIHCVQKNTHYIFFQISMNDVWI